jgi:hypothetical protein
MTTTDLLRTYGERWKLLLVGDASMHPSELTSARGNINPRHETQTSGLVWLDRLERHFERRGGRRLAVQGDSPLRRDAAICGPCPSPV